MTEIAYKAIADHIQSGREKGFDPIYLVYGEGFLIDEVLGALLDALLPEVQSRDIYFETVDPTEGEGVYDAVERINTLSFFGARKVVRLKDPGLFAGGFHPTRHLEKVKSAYEQGDLKKAARLFVELLGRRQCQAEDVLCGDVAATLGVDAEAFSDMGWVAEIAAHCRDEGLFPTGSADAAGVLKTAIEHGFPKNHHLIITADTADRRTGLYKAISACGTAVNCTVPTGARKADRDEQRRVLSQLMGKTMAAHGKTADNKVFERVFELTGFDPRAFAGNLEKLIHYVGQSPRITADAVDAVLDKSREDPIYSFTGAIAERRADNALYYLASLLASGYHAMQLLAAMTNQVRKLLLVKDFVNSRFNANTGWQPRMSFDGFKNRVMPAIVEYDTAMAEHVRALNQGEAAGGEKKKGGKKAGKPGTDLLIAKNPKNPYPVYQQFLQSERFCAQTLQDAMIALADADMRLKTTGQSPQAVLEDLVFQICRQNRTAE
ncbi:MAG: DNA polymerase III subunit delta [Thermodesulfobacteriota bacterium]